MTDLDKIYLRRVLKKCAKRILTVLAALGSAAAYAIHRQMKKNLNDVTRKMPQVYKDIDRLNRISLLTDTISMLELRLDTAIQMRKELEYGE